MVIFSQLLDASNLINVLLLGTCFFVTG
jgi:hypothetical protein